MSDDTTLTKLNYADPKIIETIKATVAKGSSDAQLAQFLEVCKATGLNPFLKEIWCIPATNTILAARDGYLRVANESPNFDGMETTVDREDGKPVKATCKVWRKDRSHPIICEAYFNEYRKDSQVWKTYPSAMISKVAEVLALKRSFAINGVVTEEEIGNPPEPRHIIQPFKSTRTIDDPTDHLPGDLDESTGKIIESTFSGLESKRSIAKAFVKRVAETPPNVTTLDEAMRFLTNTENAKFEHLNKVKTIEKIETIIAKAEEWLSNDEKLKAGGK